MTARPAIDPTAYLKRDGSNTITGVLVPDGDSTRNFGSDAARVGQFNGSRLKVHSGDGTMTIGGIAAGNNAIGVTYQGGASALIQSTANTYGGGSFAFGKSGTYGAGLATVEATRSGAFTFGGAQSFGAGTALLSATSFGSVAMGYAYATRADATVSSSGPGSFCHAYVSNQGQAGTLASVASAVARGSFVQGFCRSRKGLSYLQNTSAAFGSFTQGCIYVAGTNATGTNFIESTGKGAFTQGFAQGNGGVGGVIRTSGAGGMSQGYAKKATITATAAGAFAQGYAYNNNITASGAGSFAHGDATAGAITASAANSAQLGVGVNAVAGSLQIGQKAAAGTGLHFHGAGAPGVPVNGDIWVNGAGAITMMSGGVVCVATNAVM